MFYITFILNPRPCLSVSDKSSPPEIDFNVLKVAAPNLGFLVLALTAIPKNGTDALIAGLRILFQAVCVHLKFFCNLLLIEPPSS